VRNEFLKKTAKHIQNVKNGTVYNSQAKAAISSNFNSFESRILRKKSEAERLEKIKKEYVNGINNEEIRRASNEQFQKYGESALATLKKLMNIDKEVSSGKISNASKKEYLNEFSKKSSNNINKINLNTELAKINQMKTKNDGNNLKNRLNEAERKERELTSTIEKLQNQLKQPGLSNAERNALKKERNNLKQRINRNAENMNRMREQLGNLMVNRNGLKDESERRRIALKNANNEIANLKKKLNSGTISNAERNKLQANLNQAVKNQIQGQKNYQKLMENMQKLQNEKTTKNAIYKQLREEKLQSNKNLNLAKQRLKVKNADLLKKIDQIKQTQSNVARAKAEANAATKAATKAEENVKRAETAYTAAQENLAKQRATVNSLELELQSAKNISEEQREKLEKELSTERLQVAQASAAANKAKKNAEAAVAESRRLIANASAAANKASQRAAQAELERNTALGNKAVANRLRAEANAARKAAQAEANEARKKANAANAKANEISEKLAQANLNKAEMNNLIRQKNALLENRQKELQKQINVYRTQANKIVRNGATREATQRNRIKALENNRNRWQAEFNLAKQRLNVKNADLLKKIEQIKQTQSNIARLQKELNNTKSASATEKNAIKNQLEKEKQNLTRQFAETQTVLNSTKSQLNKITKNRNTLFKELQNRSDTLLQTRAERNKLQKQLEETKKILGNTQNNLGQLALAEQRARGQRNTLSKTLAQVRGQRQNLRRRNAASQKVITGLTKQRQNAQRGINTLRATTRNLEQKRLAANRATNNTFNASAAFNRQMKGVAARQSWKSLKPKATMIGASQLGVDKALREKLIKNIDTTTNIIGKLVVNGGFFGSERNALKKEVQNPMTGLNRLRAIEKMILNRKKNRNKKILNRNNTNLGKKLMNEVLKKRGTSVKPINYRGFAASGLNNTKRATDNTRKNLNVQGVLGRL